MLYFLKQAFWLFAFVLGMVGFFAGMFVAAPSFAVLFMLPGLEYMMTGVYHVPEESTKAAVMLAIGFLTAGAGVAFLGTSMNSMSLSLGRVVFSGVFAAAGSFFGWALYTYCPTMQGNGRTDGIVILSLLVGICTLASLSSFLPDGRRVR
jgi:hypothetical protein